VKVSNKLLFGIFLLLIGVFQESNTQVYGQEGQKDSLLAIIKKSSEPEQKVQFILQYVDQFNDNSQDIWNLLDQAMNISRNQDDISAQIIVYSSMGFTSLSSGDYTKAQKMYHEAALLANQTGDSLELYWANYSQGLVNYYLGNLKRAKEIYLSIQDYVIRSKDTLNIAALYNNLGMVYNKEKTYDKALNYYGLAYQLKKEANSPDLLNTLNNLADTYSKMDSIKKSEELFQEFYKLAYQSESVLYHTVADLNLGSVFLLKGDANGALKYLTEALKKSRQYRYKEFEHNILDDISKAYAQLKRFEKAFEYHKLSRELADSLNDIERQKNLSKLEKQFDTKLHETQIENLKIQENKSRRIIMLQKLIILFSILGIVIIGMLLLVQFRQNKTIAKQKNELISANNKKDRFFSIIAHDLRSPFNSILGLLDLLAEKDNNMSQEEFDKHLSTLEKTALSTYTLLQNLLNWARSQMENLPINIQAISSLQLIQEQCNFLNSQAVSKSIFLDTSEVSEIRLLTDRDMLSFVVRNIIGNALKFTHSEGKILIKTYVKAKDTFIEIKDNGVGIPQDKLSNIFDISSKTSSMGTNGEKGSGLGLPLCIAFMEKMGGSIQISSKQNVGTTVQICLKFSS